MPIVQCACPSCLTKLQLPQAPPVQVRCPKCGQTFLVGGGAPPPPPSAPAPLIPIQAIRTEPSKPAVTPGKAPAAGRKKLALCLSGGALFLLLVIVLVLVTKSGKGAEADDEDDPNSPPVTKSQRDTNKAIRKGVAYLQKRLQDGSQLFSIGDGRGGGANPGAVALAGLTLLECGTGADDPAVQQALRSVRGQARQLTFTYSIALAVLFLDRFNNPKERPVDPGDRALIKNMALRLIAGQNRNAGWNYFCEILLPEHEQALLKQLKDGSYRPGTLVVPGAQRIDRDDNSIGQFATLALWAARKYGVPVRPCLVAVEARYRPRQGSDGSWQYNEQIPFARDTSTCAGLIGLAVARGVEAEAEPAPGKAPAGDILKDPAVEKALRFLGGTVGKGPCLSDAERARRHRNSLKMDRLFREMEATSSPARKMQIALELRMLDQAPMLRGIYFDGDNWGDLYFLWSLERMAVIYDLKLIGGQDWHAWGSEVIVANQEDDGSWSERFPGVPDTCFALLFLRRANLVKDLTDKLRERRANSAVAAAPSNPAPPQPRRKE
jgi:hypothetical protein